MKNEKKFKVGFYGGESRQKSNKACNYMIAFFEVNEDENGEKIFTQVDSINKYHDFELYAEILCENFPGEEEYEEGFTPEFDEYSYPILKEEILRQAKENGIPENKLEFFWDE